MDIYQVAVRPFLFSTVKADPEWLHHRAIQLLSWMDQTQDRPPASWLQARLQDAFCVADDRLQQQLWGVQFANPLGLAAGFDKDGVTAGALPAFGFGFVEIGTVTCQAQPGNPRPRLFRLLADQAALNRMGFNNQGAAAMAAVLKAREAQRVAKGPDWQPPVPSIPIGINLGKSKVTPLEQAAEDYRTSFRQLQELGDYFVVNVSSPNTPGLRSLQATEQLEPILAALQADNQGQRPLLLKIAPDLDWEAIASILDLARQYQLAGIIATNTTISRDGLKTQVLEATGNPVRDEAGGLSGAPLRQRSTEVIRFIYRQTGGTLPIIGVGGIFTAEDAWEKITAGATLLQTYTGWIYEGPWMVRRILTGLLQKLEAHNLPSIAAAIGRDAS